MSRTREAIDLMQSEGISANAAAERVGVRVSAVYAGIKRDQKKRGLVPCLCCGVMGRPETFKKQSIPDF